MDNVTWEDRVMGEEVFGPILPVLTVDNLENVVETVNTHEKPLAQYIFVEDRQVIKTVTSRCSFGGGCVNDCIIHLVTSHMGFGGVGESGMGHTTAKSASIPSATARALCTRKPGWIFPCATSPIASWVTGLCGCFAIKKRTLSKRPFFCWYLCHLSIARGEDVYSY